MENRELSWLAFNDRVMQEAEDKNVPLLQRLRFLGIFSNNLDEFFKVRVASLRRQTESRPSKDKVLPGEYSPSELFLEIQRRVKLIGQEFDKAYAEILAEMNQVGIRVLNENELSDEQRTAARKYFASTVSPLIVPLMLSKRQRMPLLADDKIYLAVEMVAPKKKSWAIIEIPYTIPRFFVLPCAEGTTDVMFLDDVIRLSADEIFFMFDFKSITAYSFKLTRDAEITLDDDISKSALEKMEESLSARTTGRPVRFVYDSTMPEELLALLLRKIGLRKGDNINSGGRYHQMRALMKFPKVASAFEYDTPDPVQHHAIKPFHSIIDVISRRDVLLAYPYHSFGHFVDFLREAAVDPKVDEIYITLYRVADRSRVINALINAAKNGKTVVVLIELLARFDEENNIEWTETLQKGGVRVINGVEGLKVHSKLVLVRRREKGVLRGYTYVGTGNMNEATAQIYTDFGLLTAHEGIAADAMKLFDFLLHNHRRFDSRHLIISPWSMRTRIEKMIERETAVAKKGGEAYIMMKMNSLVDEEIIRLLYKAAAAGVKIRLIVRSACCLRAGVKGLSENIEARSIVDMYLEHPRMAIFCNQGDEQCLILSADMMGRNLDRRIEVASPIYDKAIAQSLHDVFEICWSDNVKARDLSSGAKNTYVRTQNASVRSQMALYDYFIKQQ